MKDALDKSVIDDAGWVRGNPTVAHAIRYYTDKQLHFMENYKGDSRKASVEIIRNLSIGLSSIGAVMLAAPSSALTNYLGGHLGLVNQFGFKYRDMMHEFKQSMDNQSGGLAKDVAEAVNRVAETEFLSGGRLTEFVSKEQTWMNDAESKNLLVVATRKARDATMGIADFASTKGLLMMFPSLTMKGSEENLRRYTAPVMFERVYWGIKSKVDAGIIKPEDIKAEVQRAISEHKTDVYMDMNKALGDFSPENRPFWSWMPARSDNVWQVTLGAAASMWYMFRQVSLHNMNMLMRNAANVTNPHATMKERLTGGVAGAFLINMALATYDWLTRDSKHVPRVPLFVNANPMQELVTLGRGAKLAMAHMAPAFNSWVSEDEAMEISSNLMRLAGGMLAGHTLEKTAENMRDESPSWKSFTDAVNAVGHVTAWPSILARFNDVMDLDEYSDYKKEIREALDNPIGYASFSNDYLAFLAKAIPAFTVKGDDLARQKTYDLGSMMLASFGVRPYISSMGENAYDSFYKPTLLDLDRKYFQTYAQDNFTNLRDYHGSMISRINNQLKRYGRVYDSALTGGL
ncbi:MAG: hypothetical protein ACYC3W_11805 [Candidatus Nanopelagicales bacterium]